MATIQKRGDSYLISVSYGYDRYGRQKRQTCTWKPESGMTARQIQKELKRQEVLFEQMVKDGQLLHKDVTLEEFSGIWFKDYVEKHNKELTIVGYLDLMPRILSKLGDIKLSKLNAHKITRFYNEIGEPGMRLDARYKARDGLKEVISTMGFTQKTLSEKAGIAISTIRACCNGKNVSKATADKITAALGKKGLFDNVDRDKALASSTILKYHHVLSSMLEHAVKWGYLEKNPCNRADIPRQDEKEAIFLDENQAVELINCLQSEPLKYQTATMLLLYTGVRRGELCGFRWKDVDWSNQSISISEEIEYSRRKGIYSDTPKSRKSKRTIGIPDDMLSILQEWKTEQEQQKRLLGSLWQGSDRIFTSNTGGDLRPDTYYKWFKNFVERNNLLDIHPHSLRHTSATLLLANGTDVATVRDRLGHSQDKVTYRYVHTLESKDKLAAQNLQNILGRNKSNKTA